MKIINGSNKALFLPLNQQMLTIPPRSVSPEVIGTKNLLLAILAARIPEIGIVTISPAELQEINEVVGTSQYLYPTMDEAMAKLLPSGGATVVETRVVAGGETVMQTTESVEGQRPERPGMSEEDVLQLKENASKEIGLRDEKISNLEITISNLETAVKGKDEELEALKTALKTKEKEVAEMKIKAEHSQENPELEKKVKDLEAIRDNLTKQLEEAQEANVAQKNELAETKQLLAEKIKKLEEAPSGSGISQEELDKATAERDRFKELLAKTVQENKLVWDASRSVYTPQA